MTDARLPGRWLLNSEMEQLTDRAWRIWTNVLMYCNEQGTDGLVPRTAFRFLHVEGVTGKVLDELLAVDLIEIVDGGGLQVRNWVGIGQEPAERVEQRREANRQKAKAYRGRKRARETGDVTGDAPGDDEGQDRTVTGQDRTGSGSARENVTPMAQWPTRQPGSGVVS